MDKQKIIKWGIGISLVVILLIFLGKGLTNVSVQDLEITGLEDVSPQTFTLSGNLFIDNPALVSVPIDSGEYIVVLRSSRETISTGTLPRFTLEASQVTEVDFSHEVRWRPTLSLALQMLTQDNVYADVKGNMSVNVLGITTYDVPFEEEVDIKEYLRQFRESQGPAGNVDEVTDSTGADAPDTGDAIGENDSPVNGLI